MASILAQRRPAALTGCLVLWSVLAANAQDIVSWVPLEELLVQSRLNLRVHVVSVETSTDLNLNQARFDQRVRDGETDLTLSVNASAYAKSLAREIAATQFSAVGDPARLDLRYRFDFESNGRVVISFHCDKFGDVLVEGRRLRSHDRHWLRELLRPLTEALVLTRRK